MLRPNPASRVASVGAGLRVAAGGSRPAVRAAAPQPGLRAATPSRVTAARPAQRVAQVAAQSRQPLAQNRVMPVARPQPGKAVARPQITTSGASGASGAALTVSSQSGDASIKTLTGNFTESGKNHGKPVYQKMGTNKNVFIYYWDQRDGQEQSGWWFGDRVGGEEVWSRCLANTPQPPKLGWRIPWDALKPEPGLLMVESAKTGASTPVKTAPTLAKKPVVQNSSRLAVTVKSEPSASGAGAGTGNVKAWAGKLTQHTDGVDTAEAEAQAAVADCKGLDPSSGLDDLTKAQDALTKQQSKLEAASTSLSKDAQVARSCGGAAAHAKLVQRARAVKGNVVSELGRLRGLIGKEKAKAAAAERKEKNKEQEAKDASHFETELPDAMDSVGVLEEAFEGLGALATPLVSDPPDGDQLNDACKEIQTAAQEAQGKLGDARKLLTSKLNHAKTYAPDAKQKATEEYNKLLSKITELQKKLNPYKRFKEELKQRIAATKTISDITEKMAEAELEIEKASMMALVSEGTQMPEEEVNTCQTTVKSAQVALTKLFSILQQQGKTVGDLAAGEVDEIRKRSQASKKRLEDIQNSLRKQKAQLAIQGLLEVARQRISAAEVALSKCNEAEGPFLTGLEVLPGQQSSDAVAACEKASAEADAAVSQAEKYIAQQKAAVKQNPKDVQEHLNTELGNCSSSLRDIGQKVKMFKKETTNRKVASIMSDVLEVVNSSESKAKSYADLAKPFAEPDLTVIDASKREAAATAETESLKAIQDARKAVAAKRATKDADVTKALQELQVKINAANQVVTAGKKDIAAGELLVKGKDLLAEQGGKASALESSLDNAENKSEMREELDDEAVQALIQDTDKAQLDAKSCMSTLQKELAGTAAALKGDIQKLIERCKSVNARVDKLKMAMKDQRERVLGGMFVKDATSKIETLETLLNRTDELEAPFLKGLELAVDEASEAIQESESVSGNIGKTVAETRNFIAGKSMELKKFAAAHSKTASEGLTKLAERLNVASTKLASFKKETEIRKRAMQMKLAEEKIEDFDKHVKGAGEAAAPFQAEAKEVSEMSEECEQLSTMLKTAQSKMDDARAFLGQRNSDGKFKAEHGELLKKLQKQLTDGGVELAKHRKVSEAHLGAFRKKRAVSQATEELAKVDGILEAATAACSPLLDGATRFLAEASLQTLAQGVKKHLQAKSLSLQELFKAASSRDAFIALLTELPTITENDALNFTEERKVAIFEALAKDGEASLQIVEAAFNSHYICKESITMTSGFSIADSKTLEKVEVGDEIIGLGSEQKDETSGMVRMECKRTGTGAVGFVTIKKNTGKPYFTVVSSYDAFVLDLNTKLSQATKDISSVAAAIKKIADELPVGTAPSGSITEAKQEVFKLRAKANGGTAKVDALKKSVAEAGKDYQVRLKKEKNAHLVAREQKEADAVMEKVKAKMQSLQDILDGARVATEKLTKLSEEELKAFATPATTLEEVESCSAAAKKALGETQTTIKEQQEVVKEVTKPGPLLDAKKDLVKQFGAASVMERKVKQQVEACKAACTGIVTAQTPELSLALRAHVLKRQLSAEGLFQEAVKGKEFLGAEEFTSMALAIEDVHIPLEHMKLICQQHFPSGISAYRFVGLVQQHFVVIKSIALTDVFEISSCKTVRKAEEQEILETLEGPRQDTANGLVRIKGKSVEHGTIGWITLKGNQGTAYLDEVEKPYYSFNVSAPLESASEDPETLRQLLAGEVLELLEGPKTDELADALRARVRVLKDKAVGFVTTKDGKGLERCVAATNLYVVAQAVAMTDILDVKSSKVVKKLATGTVFVSDSGIQEAEGLQRVQGKCLGEPGEEEEGWITLRGNAGTVFAKLTTKHLTVQKITGLHKTFKSSSEITGELAVGDVLEVLDAPKAEKAEPVTRIKGRVVGDGLVGWVTIQPSTVLPWGPSYLTSKVQALSEDLSQESKAVRELAVNEALEVLRGPVADGEQVRALVKADKDRAVGWVTVRDAAKKSFLKNR